MRTAGLVVALAVVLWLLIGLAPEVARFLVD